MVKLIEFYKVGMRLVLNYEMTQEEIMRGKIEGKRVIQKLKYGNIKYIIIYFLISTVGLTPLFVHIYGKNTTFSNGIKVLIAAVFTISIVTFLISSLVDGYIDKKIELSLLKSVGNIINSHYNESVKVRIELSETIKIINTYRYELSYSAVTSIREVNGNVFIEYNNNKFIYIPSKAFEGEEKKYIFIKDFKKKYELYKNNSIRRPREEDFEKLVYYKMNLSDIKNIACENENTILSKNIYSITKKKTIIVQLLVFTVFLVSSLFLNSFICSISTMLVLFLSIYYYNKVLLPMSVKERMIIALKSETKSREEQYIGIRDGFIYFYDVQKLLVQNLETLKTGDFVYRKDYLLHNIGQANNFYIPYRALNGKMTIEDFTSYFK